MSECEKLEFTKGQKERCDVRLENDTSALESVAQHTDRLQVTLRRFGARVFEIRLCFPGVKTAFCNMVTEEVFVQEARVLAQIRPNAGTGNTFPYPLAAPEVRIYFPSLLDLRYVPWLGGLLWIGGHMLPDELRHSVPPSLRVLLQMMLAEGDLQVGIPCLWRDGEWDLDCDLIFVAGQIHRLLTDPCDYSPTDAMNPKAALYWATHRDQLPLEPPIPELQGSFRCGPQNRLKSGFSLREIE